MLEIEIKLNLTTKEINKLIASAKFIKEIQNHDNYLDTPDYQLAKKGIWFRNRNGKLELKLPAQKNKDINEISSAQYIEIEDEQKIKNYLNLIIKQCSTDQCRQNNFETLGAYIVNRKTYKEDNFNICLDQTDFGYNMVEVELLLPENSDKELAEKMLWDFVINKGIQVEQKKNAMGKLPKYLQKNRPDIYDLFIQENIYIKN